MTPTTETLLSTLPFDGSKRFICPDCGGHGFIAADMLPGNSHWKCGYCGRCTDRGLWHSVSLVPHAPGFPKDASARKAHPVGTGVLDYFPLALLAVANCSKVGNDQHNPGQKLHWAREKSTDEADALIRHFMERGKLDTDGVRHSAKMAWRALALLQKEIESEG